MHTPKRPIQVGDRFFLNDDYSKPEFTVTDLHPERKPGYIQTLYWHGENLISEFFTEAFIQSQYNAPANSTIIF